MEFSGIKLLISIMFLVSTVNCIAQTGKDTTSKVDLKKKITKYQNIEKQETMQLNTEKNINSGKLYKIISDAEYYQEFKKPLLKDVFEQNIKTDKDLISENMQGILSDVRRANEDKRSFLLKTIQSALGLAQVAVVTALAVREITREVEKKPKK